jgi:hypothetical protein
LLGKKSTFFGKKSTLFSLSMEKYKKGSLSVYVGKKEMEMFLSI